MLSTTVDDPVDDSTDDTRRAAAELFGGRPGGVCTTANPESRVIREVLSRVGDKWSLLVIGALHDGALRFTELQRRIDGISHRMLTQTLRSLERDGLVSRTAYAEIPPRVEYSATPLGTSLSEPVLELVRWAAAHHDEIDAARAVYDGDEPTTADTDSATDETMHRAGTHRAGTNRAGTNRAAPNA
ncbi:helix-turn-helix domain-containing protein [Agromyces sp. LHK192]|uniref:winged helix-turn-helix transcriptional regulator n=1 Tax=Agromyces sp. LHK192 TaxID=2498704 RepID=UPI000FDB8D98